MNSPHQAYLAEDIRRELGLHREELVALAYFLGCDYTEGVTGVGIVNALEIVQAFPMRLQTDAADKIVNKSAMSGESITSNDISSSSNNSSSSSSINSSTAVALTDGRYPLEGLLKFKQWLEGYDFSETVLTKQKAKQKAESSKKKTKRKRKRGEKGSTSKTKSKPRDGDKSSSDSDQDNSSASSSGSDLEPEDEERSRGADGTVAIARSKKGHSKKGSEQSSSSAVGEALGPAGSEGECLVVGDKQPSVSGEKIPPDLATRLVSVFDCCMCVCVILHPLSPPLLLDLICNTLPLPTPLQYLFGKAHSSARARWSLKGNFPGIETKPLLCSNF